MTDEEMANRIDQICHDLWIVLATHESNTQETPAIVATFVAKSLLLIPDQENRCRFVKVILQAIVQTAVGNDLVTAQGIGCIPIPEADDTDTRH